MDLGISGKRALVCASSKGLGRGCAEALAAAGVDLVMNARGAEALEATAEHIRKTHGVSVTTVATDVTTPEGQAEVIEAAGDIDILVTNAGGPPPGMWTDWDRDDFINALDANMLTPIALIKAFVPGMMERGWGRVVNITSQSVKAPLPILGLSNSARAGLTGYVAGTSRQVAAKGVTINNLLPGIHATDRAVSLDTGVCSSDLHRPRRLAGYRCVECTRHLHGAGSCQPRSNDPSPALWNCRRIRRDLRVPVFTTRGLHRRSEPALGRWRNELYNLIFDLGQSRPANTGPHKPVRSLH